MFGNGSARKLPLLKGDLANAQQDPAIGTGIFRQLLAGTGRGGVPAVVQHRAPSLLLFDRDRDRVALGDLAAREAHQ